MSLALLAALGLTAGAGTAKIEGVEEVRPEPDGVVITLRAPEGVGRIVREEAQPARLDVAGLAATADRGGWLLPARSIWIGVPPDCVTEVSTLAVERGPFSIENDEGAGLPLAALGASSIESSPPSWMRNQRVVCLTWVPLVREGAGAGWERSVQVRVRFTGGRSARSLPGGRDAWESLYKDLIVNYEQSLPWRRLPSASRRPVGDYFSTTSHPWFRIEVASHGVYAIEGTDLQAAGLSDLSQIDPDRLCLFTGTGLCLPEETSVTELPAWLNEVSIKLEGMEDGRFEPQDRILFRGLGPDGWLGEYGRSDTRYDRYRTDEYSSVNAYWLTWGDFSGERQRWTETAGLPVTEPIETEAAHRVHYEQNTIYDSTPSELRINSGPYPDSLPGWERWHWLQVIATSRGTRSRVRFTVPDPVEGSTARLVARMWGASWDYSQTYLDHYARMIVGADSVEVSWNGKSHKDLELNGLSFSGESQTLVLTAPHKSDPANPYRQDRSYLSWFEVEYRRNLRASGDSLQFLVEPGLARRSFAASGVSDTAGLAILDVTDPLHTRMISHRFEPEDGTSRVEWSVEPLSGGERRIILTNLKAARGARVVLDAPPGGGYLRERSEPIDYILITHASFAEAAEELAAWRSEHSPDGDGFRVAVVDVQDIYDEFSAGRVDPTAIRNFLHLAFLQWNGGDPQASPSTVLLLGDAAFDFRNRLKLGARVTVPSYGGFYDPSLVTTIYSPQFASDDWFVLYDPPPDATLEMEIGRLPADTAADAAAMVQKVRDYESNQDTGAWRQRFTLVADDVCQGLNCDYPLVFTHLDQTEDLADQVLPRSLQRDRIYLYEFGKTCIYDRKPDAATALRKSIEEGTLVVNYTGHGSEEQLADEKVLETPGVASMTNGDRLFFFLTASCSVGKFDFAGEGLSEALVRRAGGGAIAALSATAVAYSPTNAELNRQFFLAAFPNRDASRARPIAEALVRAKMIMGTYPALNNRRYPILGEPAITLNVPPASVRVQVETLRPAGPAAPDTLMRGARVVIRGEVVDLEGTPITDVQGTAWVRVYDSEIERDETVLCRDVAFSATYNLTGAPILRQTVPVADGRFELELISPTVLRTGAKGMAQVYVNVLASDGRKALGSDDNLTVTENAPLLPDDNEGPRIVLTPQGDPEEMIPGAEWQAVLTDSSGINITQLVSSRSVILQITEGSRLVHAEDLAGAVTFPEGYAVGRLSFRLPEDMEGGRRYRLTLSASDNLNQGSSASADFYLTEGAGAGLALERIYNVPNPTEGASTFFVEMSQQAEVIIRIFTVSGRTVREIKAGMLTPADSGEKGIYWDGHDEEGDLLANGVYFYKVSIRGKAGEKRDRVERLAVLR